MGLRGPPTATEKGEEQENARSDVAPERAEGVRRKNPGVVREAGI